MKKSKAVILFSIWLLFLVTIVMAFDLGDTFTQQQVDNADFNSMNLQATLDDVRLDTFQGERVIRFYVSWLSFQRTGNTYKIVRLTDTEDTLSAEEQFIYPVQDFKNCLQANTQMHCARIVVKPIIIQKVKNALIVERANFINLKTRQVPTVDVIKEDFGITNNELNQN